MKKFEKKDESILDQPNSGMCPDVWVFDEGSLPKLTDEARGKIQAIVDWAVETFDIINHTVNITGSITSNSYSDDSDIDVHIASPVITEKNSDDLNKKLRHEFSEQFKGSFQGRDMVNGHPIEVYFQSNPIQDLMSVGCYDFVNAKWLVGPEMKPIDYDPYSEYYDEDLEYVDKIVCEMRSVIMRIYELCVVLKDSKDHKFRNERIQELISNMSNATSMFDEMREMRTAYSSPKTREVALRLRNSPKWKIADSAFKLMDKFGYLPILKFFKTSYEQIKSSPGDIFKIADEILGRFNLKGNTGDWRKPKEQLKKVDLDINR